MDGSSVDEGLWHYGLRGEVSGGALRPAHNSLSIFDSERVVRWFLGAGAGHGGHERHAILYQIRDALHDRRALHVLLHALDLSLPERPERAGLFPALRDRHRPRDPDAISVRSNTTRDYISAPDRYGKARADVVNAFHRRGGAFPRVTCGLVWLSIRLIREAVSQ